LGATLDRVAADGDRFVLARRGKPLAVLVSPEDLARLQEMEDADDLRAARVALAERADLHRTYVADIERGVRNVGLKNIGKLARALDLTVSKLCTGVEKDGR
jgi:prevent-host-death family protein